MGREVIIKAFGEKWPCFVRTFDYTFGGTAVSLLSTKDEEPFATISVWLALSPELPKGQFFGKHWSENEGILEQLVEQKVIEKVNYPPQSSGFVTDICAYKLLKEEER